MKNKFIINNFSNKSLVDYFCKHESKVIAKKKCVHKNKCEICIDNTDKMAECGKRRYENFHYRVLLGLYKVSLSNIFIKMR